MAADSPAGRRCIFCGSGGPLSKEHVLARWIRKRFPCDGTQEHWHRTDAEDGTVRERRYRIVPFELTVREVCRGCNNGWMADLETLVRPILGPMMTSSINLPLSIDEQESLAIWAAKTLMVAQSTLLHDLEPLMNLGRADLVRLRPRSQHRGASA